MASLTITNEKKEKLVQVGCFRGGHNDHVLSIGTLYKFPDRIISTSRDKSVLVWKLNRGDGAGDSEFAGSTIHGKPFKRYTGHSHFVTGIVTSTDSTHAITTSWDRTLRLWDLVQGKTTQLFKGHTGDVTSISLSHDNRQVVTGSRDKTVKFWSVTGTCHHTVGPAQGGHNDWVSSVALAPQYDLLPPNCFSASWDSTIKVINSRTYQVQKTMVCGQKGSPVVTMQISPDISLVAFGTKDNTINLWDLETYSYLWSVAMPGEVKAIAFAPNSYQVCVAVNSSIFVYDLVRKVLLDEAILETSTTASASAGNKSKPEIVCLKWSIDGNTLFAGYTDGNIRAWKPTIISSIKIDQD